VESRHYCEMENLAVILPLKWYTIISRADFPVSQKQIHGAFDPPVTGNVSVILSHHDP